MTLQILREPVPARVAGSHSTRRESLVLGSLFNAKPAAELKLPNAAAKAPETPQQLLQALSRRTKIWELNASLHCSIIGTCLSTADIRQVLGKLNVAGAQALSDHDLHKHGVSLAAHRDGSAKLLQKALDRKHQRVISQFDRAKANTDLAGYWNDAVQRSEIPGAYWALLSHPLAGEALVKRAFGEVHMLSHLVGAANRADIRRLSDLEAENAALRGKVARQQEQVRDVVITRDAKINDLNILLTRAQTRALGNTAPTETTPDASVPAALVASLERRLSSEASHRQRIEERLKAAEDKLVAERNARLKAEQQIEALSQELSLAESGLADPARDDGHAASGLAGQAILYVGGQTGHVSGLRDIADRFEVTLLHHDGGLEDRGAQLAGLISQAQMVVFPVDFVSHDAMQMVKRLARQAGKPYVPLRSAGLTSFLVALRAAETLPAREHATAGF